MLVSRIADPELVAGFYEAAADPKRWHRTWSAVCRAFEAPTGVFFQQASPAAAPRILAEVNWTGASPGLLMGAFMTSGGIGRAAASSSHYRTLVGREVISPQAVPHDELFAAIWRPAEAGASHILAASVPLDGLSRAGLGLQRPIDAPEFDEDDRAALDGMARHLAAALRLANVLETERASNTVRGAALDRLRHGAVIVAADCTVHFANDAALRMAAGGGLVLDEGGKLSCANESEASKLAAIVRGAADGGAGGCARISRGPRQPMLAAVVTPLPVDMAEEVALEAEAPQLVLVSIRDLSDTCDAAQTYLMQLFGLTSAEAAILPQLLAGDSASLIAQSRGVQVATVRTQVARVLTKTGAANLRALVSMVAALG